jgi:hypothetical protein
MEVWFYGSEAKAIGSSYAFDVPDDRSSRNSRRKEINTEEN